MTTMTETHEHVWVATVTEIGDRAIMWREALGSQSVPIKSPIPEPCSIEDRGAVAAFLVDFERLPDGALITIARALGRRRGVSVAEVLGDLAIDKSIPILADGVRVSTACCDYVTGREAEEGESEAFRHQLGAEIQAIAESTEILPVELTQLQAMYLMGALQLAAKHPHLTGEPLAFVLGAGVQLQEKLCPSGTAMERLALLGWTGR